MTRSATDAFTAAVGQLAPASGDLLGGEADAAVFEAFKAVRAAAHPDVILGMQPVDYVGRGLLAHALFLHWRERREAEFLLDGIRQHMLAQLRENRLPHPDVYRLGEALTRFCDAWRRSGGDE
jgi:hypothetical protein